MPIKRHRHAHGESRVAGSFGAFSSQSPRLYRGALAILTGVSAFAVLRLFIGEEYNLAIGFSLVSLTTLACLYFWTAVPLKGLPFLPLFLLQQGVIYGVPLFVGDENLKEVSSGTLFLSLFSVVLLLVSALLGHRIGFRSSSSPPPLTRWSFFPGGGMAHSPRTANLCLTLLCCSILFYLTTRSGLLYQLLPGSLWSLFPVIRTGSDAASMFGALIGGIALVNHPQKIKSVIYWCLLTTIFFLSIADVLLSAATGLIIATSIGVALGRARFPWPFLIIAFLLLGFLNQGKFTVREKYWDPETNTTRLAVSQLPSFYLDWASTSAEQLLWKEDDIFEPTTKPAEEKEGQNLLDRIDNLQILTFVVDAIETREKATLSGRTYALIPPLLVPRFLWPEKPRSHEGQVLLNIHFERQKDREETEKTYIAWGLLPESIGNFGPYLGPVFLGILVGFVAGKLEYFSIRKELFSIEGLILLALLLKVTTSFEMVSSVFVTSTFQFLVVVAMGSWFICLWFRSAPPATSPCASLGQPTR